MTEDQIEWLLASDEPWTRYRTLVDLLDRAKTDPETKRARAEMLAHRQVDELIRQVAQWPGYALKRHNDARHPLYKLNTLADFGVRAGDPGMAGGIEAILAHQSPEGALQNLIQIPISFSGTGESSWAWMSCDAPALLYPLLAMGMGDEARVRRAIDHLVNLIDGNGWRCRAAAALGNFRGPGRKADPCPIATLTGLKVLSQVADLVESRASHTAAEMLLDHWEQRGERKFYLFGIGTDFCKLKYPFVWYDLLHVVEVLSRFAFVRHDPRFGEMLAAIVGRADSQGRYSAASMYRAWEGWSFADKKNPSPWLTFLVERINTRIGSV